MDLHKIDALVAERVMGWTRDPDGEREGVYTWWINAEGNSEDRLFNPTTDGNDMLAVVERMAAKPSRRSANHQNSGNANKARKVTSASTLTPIE